jgi:hypothetical protein
LIQLKHENDFVWGDEQKEAFKKIKRYLMSPPVLRALRIGQGFRLYIAAQEYAIGAVLTQEDESKEFVIAYLNRRLLDAKTRYLLIEKLFLSLYYSCTKLRHYLLMNTCTVVCQHDIIKCMLQKHILSGRLGKWAYDLVEYDL